MAAFVVVVVVVVVRDFSRRDADDFDALILAVVRPTLT